LISSSISAKRVYSLLALLLAFAAAAMAQSRPDLIWEGEITSAATLFIRGNQVDVQGRDTVAVDRPRSRFRNPLPASARDVKVSVRTGSGRVTVEEQPSKSNDYTLIVDIDNRGNEPQYYTLDFFWRPGRQDGSAGSVSWSGEVDHEAIVTLRGQYARSRPVQGKPVAGDYARFTTSIPRSKVLLRLVESRGRGLVELIEQPSASNNYCARVRILDTASGAAEYSFTLIWDPPDQPGDERPDQL
jgi:hypothetical protein